MKFIYKDDEGVWQLGPYLKYLAQVKGTIPQDLSDLCDRDRYDIRSRRSLHDSWISRISLREQFLEAQKPSQIGLEIELLGPYHDRVFMIRYDKVSYYNLAANGHSSGRHRGDLLVHELRVGENGNFEHEYSFSNEGRIEIYCQEMSFTEVPVALGNH